jgi:hypothetical protein
LWSHCCASVWGCALGGCSCGCSVGSHSVGHCCRLRGWRRSRCWSWFATKAQSLLSCPTSFPAINTMMLTSFHKLEEFPILLAITGFSTTKGCSALDLEICSRGALFWRCRFWRFVRRWRISCFMRLLAQIWTLDAIARLRTVRVNEIFWNTTWRTLLCQVVRCRIRRAHTTTIIDCVGPLVHNPIRIKREIYLL